MRLLAISDLHIGYAANRQALEALPAHPQDWLIVGGDVGETEEQLVWAMQQFTARFARVIWVPGNHELWAMREGAPRGVARYERLVALCRALGVLTPEDPWVLWPGAGPPTVIAPMFLLYDYSFAPDGVGPGDAVAWAAEDRIVARDEQLLHPDPYPTRQAWCAARVEATAARLDAVPEGHGLVLINHWPLRRDLVRLFSVSRYIPWCGTRATENWHLRYPVRAVVHGHLHVRATDWRDGVRFEEVAIGYPRHWRVERGMDAYLREILPGPPTPAGGFGGPLFHR